MDALIISARALDLISISGTSLDDALDSNLPVGCFHIAHKQFTYILHQNDDVASRLLVIKSGPSGLLREIPNSYREESFLRLARAALTQFRPGFSKIPLDWKVFHTGSLISFQANRRHAGVTSRFYIDVSPEGYNHVYMFRISTQGDEPLDRIDYDFELLVDAILSFDAAMEIAKDRGGVDNIGHLTISLTDTFSVSSIFHGIPFSTWRDAKLNRRQRSFFDAPFDGPLRVRGPAGTGKTLVLSMRFLKQIYDAVDLDSHLRLCFIAHGEETAQMIVKYLLQIDERSILYNIEKYPQLDIEITTLHGLANRYINRDTENIQPLSLDGTEGRQLQHEIIESILKEFVRSDWVRFRSDCREEFVKGVDATFDSREFKAFCYDLSDEFANVLEVFGVRGLDDIGQRYLRSKPSERALAKTAADKRVVLELYRQFRHTLAEMNVVSLDQFTADFLAYLNSFRWEALRKEKGFDFVFADELHLFNAQERRVLGFLLRDPNPPRRVAVAYDPRQSPRNSFFPEAVTPRDTVWSEAGLDISAKAFELQDVFRYTPQIMSLLSRLNDHFPASDLAEDWSISFGRSEVKDGPLPTVREHKSQLSMAEFVSQRARDKMSKVPSGEQIAVLCLDPNRFDQYKIAGLFDGFVSVAGRNELGLIDRFRKRPIVSMPEYVAGLQFSYVILIDANAFLVSELGGGANGLHKFISTAYLGASRAKIDLEIHADLSAGGLAEPIRDAFDRNLLRRM